MDNYTADEVREARAPIASLLSKSEKAQQKVAPGTWQHAMLQRNIQALRIAVPLIGTPDDDSHGPAPDDLEAALRALDSMIERVADTETKFAPGTSQHTLQRNRLKALRIARAVVVAKLGS
jgi:hypothetical protein